MPAAGGGAGGGAGGPGGPGPGGPGGRGGRSTRPGRFNLRNTRKGNPQKFQNSGDGGDGGNEVLGIDVQSDKGASKIQAKLSRKQFEDFKERFAPLQRDLKEFALSGAGQQEAVNEADFAVRQRFERSDEQRGREFSRFGINRTGQQQQAAERSRDLDEVTARVGARNVARRAADRRKSQLLVGGVESSVSPGLGAIKRPREEDS